MKWLSRLLATQWHAIRLLRISERLDHQGHPHAASVMLQLGKLVSGIEIVHGARIGSGTVFIHGYGTVIGPGVVIGENCRIFHQTTFGSRDGALYPTVGDDVIVYPGAKILGGIHVGDGAIIGANAVVLHDVPAGCVAAGAPATYTEKP